MDKIYVIKNRRTGNYLGHYNPSLVFDECRKLDTMANARRFLTDFLNYQYYENGEGTDKLTHNDFYIEEYNISYIHSEDHPSTLDKKRLDASLHR